MLLGFTGQTLSERACRFICWCMEYAELVILGNDPVSYLCRSFAWCLGILVVITSAGSSALLWNVPHVTQTKISSNCFLRKVFSTAQTSSLADCQLSGSLFLLNGSSTKYIASGQKLHCVYKAFGFLHMKLVYLSFPYAC